MVKTVNPKAKLTPRNPIPSDGKSAARTALPRTGECQPEGAK